ncbi:MAG: sigma-70 family RNA polymerase sigma factor [Bacteroidota bacterium]
MTASEPYLLAQARTGDQGAFRQLVLAHEARVRSTAFGMLGDESTAEDIAQEVFIKLYQNLNTFRGDSKLSSYLIRMTINHSLNELKRRKRKSRWLSWDAEQVPQLEDHAAHPDRSDTKSMVQQALKLLPTDFRTVVVLRLIEGYSVKETAQVLKLPEGTVASRLARAQKKLKTIFEQWDALVK